MQGALYRIRLNASPAIIPDALQRETVHRVFCHPGTAKGGIRDRYECRCPLRSRIRRARRSGMTKSAAAFHAGSRAHPDQVRVQAG